MEATFVLRNPSGLHARPASLFVSCVQRFSGTEVFVRKGAREVSGRSLLAILSLGISAGTAVTIRTEGPRAADAMDEIRTLMESGFGE